MKVSKLNKQLICQLEELIGTSLDYLPAVECNAYNDLKLKQDISLVQLIFDLEHGAKVVTHDKVHTLGEDSTIGRREFNYYSLNLIGRPYLFDNDNDYYLIQYKDGNTLFIIIPCPLQKKKHQFTKDQDSLLRQLRQLVEKCQSNNIQLVYDEDYCELFAVPTQDFGKLTDQEKEDLSMADINTKTISTSTIGYSPNFDSLSEILFQQ